MAALAGGALAAAAEPSSSAVVTVGTVLWHTLKAWVRQGSLMVFSQ